MPQSLRNGGITEQGHLMFAPARVSSPEKNAAKVEALQSPVSQAVEVVSESRRMADIDDFVHLWTNNLASVNEGLTSSV